jgi:Bacterial Ig-like domain
VARAAHDPRRQAPRLGLLILATACALAQEPPGGPPDFTPPVLLAVSPDSAAILPGFHDPVVFSFNEVINERSAADLSTLFVVSPRHEEIRVSWKRTRLEVRPKDGWRQGAVYRVVLLPGVQDLRNNRLRTGGEVVFSTGPPIPDTRVTANVVDWAAGRLAGHALLEAYPLPIEKDSTAYIAQADSGGDILLTRVPPGEYLLVGVIDDNGNRRRDRREAFDSTTIHVDSVADQAFWAFVHDTVGPALHEVTRIDSITLRLAFSQSLHVGAPDGDSVAVFLLPDSTPVSVARLLAPAAYDTLAKQETAVRDSLRAVAADSARAAGDTSRTRGDTTRAADTTARVLPDTTRLRTPGRQPPEREGAAPAPNEPTPADTGRVAMLLRERPRLFDQLVVRLAAPLTPGARYVIQARVANVSGAVAETRSLLSIPDTTAKERR